VKRQRGFFPALGLSAHAVKWLVVLALLAAIAWAVAHAVDTVADWVEKRNADLVESGRKAERTVWQERDNKALRTLQAELKTLRDEKEQAEREHATEVARLDKEKTDAIRQIDARKDQFVADVAAGRIRLFDPGRVQAGSCPGRGGEGGAATADAAGRVGDGTGGGELSPAFAGKLVAEANRADKVVEKVLYLQGYITRTLKACNPDP
jgi:hypothetical protein